MSCVDAAGAARNRAAEKGVDATLGVRGICDCRERV